MKNKHIQSLKNKPLELIFLISFSTLYFLVPSMKYLLSFLPFGISNYFNYVLIAMSGALCIYIIVISFIFKKNNINNIVCLFLFFYIVVIVLSTFINHISDTVLTPLLLITMLIIFFQGITLFTDIKKILFCLLISTLIFCLIYLFDYLPKIIANKSISRLGEDFGDLNEVGIFFSIGVAVSLIFVVIFKDKKKIFLAIPSFCISIFCGICTGSKAFIICSLLLILVSVILFFGKKRWYISTLFIVFLFALSIFILTLPIFSNVSKRFFEFIFSLFSKDSSLDASSSDRLKMIKDGFLLFLRRPFFGYGNKGYYHFSSTGGGGWSHNNYIEVLVQYGLIGLIVFLFPFVFTIVQIMKDRVKSTGSKISLLLLIFFFVYFMSVSFDTLKEFSFIGAVLFVIASNINPTKGGNYVQSRRFDYIEIWT